MLSLPIGHFSFTKNIYSHLPIDLLIVRNGESDGSVMIREKKKQLKINEEKAEALSKVHNSKWRLTKLGVIQARAAGEWISFNFPKPFDAYMTGEYVRSLETAYCLNLPDSHWFPSLYLRPRDYGYFSILDHQINQEEFKKHMAEKSRDSFYWTPPNGESIAHLTLRTERVIHWIRNHVPENGSVIIVTHKDVMESLRIRIEHISQIEYKPKVVEPPPEHVLHYGSILHYTRRNPKTGKINPNYKWMRVLTPWLGDRHTPETFYTIKIKHLGNSQLRAEISNLPHIFPCFGDKQ